MRARTEPAIAIFKTCRWLNRRTTNGQRKIELFLHGQRPIVAGEENIDFDPDLGIPEAVERMRAAGGHDEEDQRQAQVTERENSQSPSL
jgi:hypothetical protein